MTTEPDKAVSRRRYQRSIAAREEAERLLEGKSRELFEANQKLSKLAASQEEIIQERTSKLQTALTEAEEAITARSRFIATMSHEIRTPLGGILGMIDILLEQEDDLEKREYLNNAKIAGSALKRIVNDVLDLSRMEQQALHLADEDVDVRALLSGVVALFRIGFEGANRKFHWDIQTEVPKAFRGDATRVRQVISNLTSNAVRYSQEGDIYFRLVMQQRDGKDILRFEIEDEGVGIAPDRIGDLFKDFSQIHNDLTQVAESSGLGLAICKRIVEAMKGQIGVASEVGVGTVFWFEIPVEAAKPENVQRARVRTRPISDTRGLSALVAEDNVINQKIITTFLSSIGVEYELAKNGRIAVEKFKPGQFDVLLMDVAMPEMDGFQAIRKIREMHPAKDIPPIMILTAHVTEAIQDEAGMLGIKTVLNKPITKKELQNALATVSAGRASAPASARKPENPPDSAAETALDTLKRVLSPITFEELSTVFDEAELAQLLHDYIVSAEDTLAKLNEHFAQSAWEELSRQAHSLKGSSSLLGFDTIVRSAEWLEGNASEANANDSRAHIVQLTNAIGNLRCQFAPTTAIAQAS